MTDNANKILAIKNRIHVLTMRDVVTNHNLINKLNRRLRKLENESLNN